MTVGWWVLAGGGVALGLVVLAVVAFRIMARQDERRVQLLRRHWADLGHIAGDPLEPDRADDGAQGDDDGGPDHGEAGR